MTIDDELAAVAASLDAAFAAHQPAILAALRAHGISEAHLPAALRLASDEFERQRSEHLTEIRGMLSRRAAMRARITFLERRAAIIARLGTLLDTALDEHVRAIASRWILDDDDDEVDAPAFLAELAAVRHAMMQQRPAAIKAVLDALDAFEAER